MHSSIRNIAIIAHVDHGKTTLVDRLLQATHVFRDNQQVAERVLDFNDQERERGITILAKNISIRHRGVKINVIDTPGHADFGGEVERVLKMADGALLIVDAFEGPMPQTRFVLRRALEHGLKPLVVINKIDRPGARPHEVLDAVFDLMLELGANDRQLDFPVVYTSAVHGYARHEFDDGNMDMRPLLDAIVDHVPPPPCDPDGPVALQVCTIDYSTFVGRIGIGRVFSGTVRSGARILVVKNDGRRFMATVKQLYTFEGMGRVEADAAAGGDICAVVGVEDADIGDMFTCPEHPVILDPIQVEPPTLSVVFAASTSPLVGREGAIVGGRQLKERLLREAQSNISMVIRETPGRDGMEVAGRGILHLAVLMETMRREGYEFQVGRPQVILRQEESRVLEPVEHAVVEVPAEYAGKVIELFGGRGGEMTEMVQGPEGVHLEFKISTRGLMGLRTRLLNATRGEATLHHRFLEYGPHRGDVGARPNGSMIAMSTDKAAAYALNGLQPRGRLFVGPGEMCYEGMIVGEHAKDNDLVVNVARAKQQTNMRASTADKAILLAPPATFTLEEALEYIEDDELVEITPQNIRLRKRLLDENDRKKARSQRSAEAASVPSRREPIPA
ncbi:MAG TPA: translational GTPase TypA [Acidobacteriota bacterium]|nr:translational GTPase TypA [Acidobacteriota bacterium]HQG93387.1 translational GTPase TypA [Acidobacteriota bacterium]HQK88127.1 translational GTPase TypA [Acidobacteriota bacterium]